MPTIEYPTNIEYFLFPDVLVEEYECFLPPGEIHIDLEEQLQNRVRKILLKSKIPIDNSNLLEEELKKEITQLENFLVDFQNYILDEGMLDNDRLYYAYSWTRYKEKKKPIVNQGHLENILSKNKKQEEDNSKNKEEYTPEKITNNTKPNKSLHLFNEEDYELKIRLFKEGSLGKIAEEFFLENGFFAEEEDILKEWELKLEEQCDIARTFFKFGNKEKSLNQRLNLDDFYFSFENEYFLFFYGKTIYKFSYKEEKFFLGNKPVNLVEFFSKLKERKIKTWEQISYFKEMFSKEGLNYSHDYNNKFFFYKLVEEEEYIRFFYKNIEKNIVCKENKYYRLTGEEIIKPEILCHEFINFSLERKKANLKAKQFFETFLNKKEKNELLKKKSLLIKGEKYDYIFCPNIYINPIIRINKKSEKIEALCVMLQNPHIPRWDVLASAMLLIKTRQEEKLNANANAFETNNEHLQILKTHTINEDILEKHFLNKIKKAYEFYLKNFYK